LTVYIINLNTDKFNDIGGMMLKYMNGKVKKCGFERKFAAF